MLRTEYLHEAFDYRDGNLFWKSRPRSHFTSDNSFRAWNTSNAGNPISSMDKDGYLRVRLDGVRHKAHRIIWMMKVGSIPEGMVIDHINHNKSDNRLSNLRLVAVETNNRNAPMRADNTSGVTGVNWNERAKKYQATISISGKRKSLGYFSSLHSAKAARKNAELEVGYHKNHGSKEVL